MRLKLRKRKKDLVFTIYNILIHLSLGSHSNEFIDLILHPTLESFDLLQDQTTFDHLVNHIASMISSRGSRGRREGHVWRATVNQ